MTTDNLVQLEGPLLTAGAESDIALAEIQNDRARLLQAAWSDCMSLAGFDFPQAPPPIDTRRRSDTDEVSFAKEFGFGVSTAALLAETPFRASSEEGYILSALDEMDEQEAGAFRLHFFGDSLLPTLPGFVPDSTKANGGVRIDEESCYWAGRTTADKEIEDTYPEQRRFKAIQTASNDVIGLYSADVETVETYMGYTSCLQDKGYEPLGEGIAGAVSIAAANYNSFVATHGSNFANLNDAASNQLERVRSAERTLAISALECEVAIRGTLASIYSRVEDQYLRENPDTALLLASE